VSTDTRGAQPVPELVSETAVDAGEPDDLTFTPQQWARFSTRMKRRLAAEADTDAVNGSSTTLEIRAYFVTQREFVDYAADAVPDREREQPRVWGSGETYDTGCEPQGRGRTLHDYADR